MPTVRERHQHLDRMQLELKDQHGRVWLAQSEMGRDVFGRPRLAPVGTFQPMFDPPYRFFPPQKYLVFDARRPSVLTIAYGAWIADQRARHQEIEDYLSQLAWSIYKDQAPQFIKQPTPEMLEIVYGRGKGPEPWEPILAAQQGNGWILGLRPFDPDRRGDVALRPYLERWVEVRYRDARPWEDGEFEVGGLQFGDEPGERAEAPVMDADADESDTMEDSDDLVGALGEEED